MLIVICPGWSNLTHMRNPIEMYRVPNSGSFDGADITSHGCCKDCFKIITGDDYDSRPKTPTERAGASG